MFKVEVKKETLIIAEVYEGSVEEGELYDVTNVGIISVCCN